MKLRVPPVVVFGVALSLTIGCYYLFLDFSYQLPFQKTLSRVLLVIGVLSGVVGIITFRNHKTTVDPMNPQNASALVSTGIYQYTRNPMYLGMALILFGAAIRLGNPIGFFGPLFFVTFITRFQIKAEEAALAKVFGQDFVKYSRKVRRWI